MLQLDTPEDFVLATGQTTPVRTFCELAFKAVGIELAWEGSEENEKGYRTDTGDVIIEVDPRYYRPTEVDLLLGDATKARELLGWVPKCSLEQMVVEMVEHDAEAAREELTLKVNHPA